MNGAWERFFQHQRSPMLRSQLLTALMTGGKPLEVESLPSAVLLDTLLLAAVARQEHEAEIVDDYDGLLARVNREWAEPAWTCKRFDQRHSGLASLIAIGNSVTFTDPDVEYLVTMVGTYLNQDAAPEFFGKVKK